MADEYDPEFPTSDDSTDGLKKRKEVVNEERADACEENVDTTSVKSTMNLFDDLPKDAEENTCNSVKTNDDQDENVQISKDVDGVSYTKSDSANKDSPMDSIECETIKTEIDVKNDSKQLEVAEDVVYNNKKDVETSESNDELGEIDVNKIKSGVIAANANIEIKKDSVDDHHELGAVSFVIGSRKLSTREKRNNDIFNSLMVDTASEIDESCDDVKINEPDAETFESPYKTGEVTSNVEPELASTNDSIEDAEDKMDDTDTAINQENDNSQSEPISSAPTEDESKEEVSTPTRRRSSRIQTRNQLIGSESNDKRKQKGKKAKATTVKKQEINENNDQLSELGPISSAINEPETKGRKTKGKPAKAQSTKSASKQLDTKNIPKDPECNGTDDSLQSSIPHDVEIPREESITKNTAQNTPKNTRQKKRGPAKKVVETPEILPEASPQEAVCEESKKIDEDETSLVDLDDLIGSVIRNVQENVDNEPGKDSKDEMATVSAEESQEETKVSVIQPEPTSEEERQIANVEEETVEEKAFKETELTNIAAEDSLFDLYGGIPTPVNEIQGSASPDISLSVRPQNDDSPSDDPTKRPEKVKSRWRRSCELESLNISSSDIKNSETDNDEIQPKTPTETSSVNIPNLVSELVVSSSTSSPTTNSLAKYSANSSELDDPPKTIVSCSKLRNFFKAKNSSDQLETDDKFASDVEMGEVDNGQEGCCSSDNIPVPTSTSGVTPQNSEVALSWSDSKYSQCSEVASTNEVIENSSLFSLKNEPDENFFGDEGSSDSDAKMAAESDQKVPFLRFSPENFKNIPGLPQFSYLPENKLISGRKKSRDQKEVRRMQCDCYLSKEDIINGYMACGDDCLNRLLMIECGSRCSHGDLCSNKRYQKREYVNVSPFKTQKKGWGLQTLENLSSGQFIMEYVGEVLNSKEFKQRVKQYSKDKNQHYFFMSLRADEILDATYAGNVSRFINHSCSPNVETQKWTVNGELRIGFFAKKFIASGDELTFDYQFQRYGREAQKCYCESEICRGFIGGDKQVSLKTNKVLTTKRKKTADEKKRELFEDMDLDIEVEKLNLQGGLKNREDTLKLCRLMVRAEDANSRNMLLNILQNTSEQGCLRLFLDYHGLSLIWSWMANVNDDDIKLKTQILETFVLLPITNKTILEESKVMEVVRKWAMQLPLNAEAKDSKETDVKADTQAIEQLEISELKPVDENQEMEALSESDTKFEFTTDDNIFPENAEINIDDIPLPPSPPPRAVSDCDMDTSHVSNSVVVSNGSPDSEEKQQQDGCFEVQEPAEENNECAKKDGDVDCPKSEAGDTKEEDKTEPCQLPDSSSAVEMPEQKNDNPSSDVTGEDSQDSQSIESGVDNKSDDEDQQEVGKNNESEDVANLASKILESWSSLQELFKIPKRELDSKEEEKHEKSFENSPEHNGVKRPRRSVSPFDTPSRSGKRTRRHEGDRINKHERRRKFALEMKQKDEEEAIRRQEELQRIQEEERIQKQNELIFSAAANLCSDPVYQIPQETYNGVFIPTQPLPDPNLALVQPTQIPADPNAIFNHPPPQIPGQQFMPPQTNMPPPAVLPQMFPPADLSAPPVYSQQPQPHIITGHPQTMLPPQAIQAIPGQYQLPPNIALPTQQPQLLAQPMLQQHPAASTNAPQYLHPQGPQLIQQPQSSGAPLYFIQHPSGQPQPVVIMPEAEKPEVALPPSPPKSKKNMLPPNWRSAKDNEGNTYYYHSITRKTQWDPPAWPIPEEPSEPSHSSDKHKHSRRKSFSTTTAAADTSSELVKKTKELFRAKISSFIVHCLNPFRKPDCKLGRIVSTDDFKHLARKLTHFVMAKELKHCQNVEDLECNDNVKHKTRDFVNKYLAKYGPVYKKDKSSPKEY